MAEYFSRLKRDVERARRPREGLAKLRDDFFEAVILDVLVPELDGVALCRLIRKGSGIPVFTLTARGELTNRVVDPERGADDYHPPHSFEPRELVACLPTMLRRREVLARRRSGTGYLYRHPSKCPDLSSAWPWPACLRTRARSKTPAFRR